MWKREFYYLNDYIEELLHSERRGIAKYHARPIALVALKYGNLLSPEWKDMSMQELQEILEKQHLLERKTEISFIREKEQIREVFVPTKYGEEIGMIKGLEQDVSPDILSAVKELCLAVYEGDYFNDEKYNELISYIQSAAN